MLSSISVTEQVETLSIFYLRTKTCARFDPYRRTGGNLISILSKYKLKSYLYFTQGQKPTTSLTSVTDQKRTLIWLHRIHKWAE